MRAAIAARQIVPSCKRGGLSDIIPEAGIPWQCATLLNDFVNVAGNKFVFFPPLSYFFLKAILLPSGSSLFLVRPSYSSFFSFFQMARQDMTRVRAGLVYNRRPPWFDVFKNSMSSRVHLQTSGKPVSLCARLVRKAGVLLRCQAGKQKPYWSHTSQRLGGGESFIFIFHPY